LTGTIDAGIFTPRRQVMIVMKFGGTSVANAKMMDNALDIAAEQLDRSPLLVSSAMSGITDTLLAIADSSQSGDETKAAELIEEIRERHISTADEFLSGNNLIEALSNIKSLIEKLSSLSKGLLLLRECTPRSGDALVCFGELLSTSLLSFRAKERGIRVELIDAREFVVTDDEFSSASPVFDETYAKIRSGIRPEPGKLLITQGFIGTTRSGATATLGRGGSDFTATIFGGALEADEVQIWTDVNGIMTTDPRIVSDAYTIPEISYEEAAELAYFGAKVVHPSTIQPAVKAGIPVLVKNTKDPDGVYSAITSNISSTGLRAIAGKKKITLINIESSRMLNAYGFLSRIFTIFEKHRTPVDLIATSEVSVSMTIDNPKNLLPILEELQSIGGVSVQEERGIICLVGQDFWKDSSYIARVFQAMKGFSVGMISLGSSDINLSLVVPEAQMEEAVKRLHKEFFT
jgi:aspartate kinase